MGVDVRTIEKRPARRGAKQFFPIGALVVTHTRTEVGATSYAPSPNALGRSLGRDFPFHSVSAVLTVMSSFTGIAQVVSTPSQRTTSAFPGPKNTDAAPRHIRLGNYGDPEARWGGSSCTRNAQRQRSFAVAAVWPRPAIYL